MEQATVTKLTATKEAKSMKKKHSANIYSDMARICYEKQLYREARSWP